MKPPPAKDSPKQESKVQTVKVNNTKAEKAPEENKTAAANTTVAETNSTGAGLDDDILRQIRERKAGQDKTMGTDALGKKEADKAKEVTDTKKDMTVPEAGKESLKDDAPSLAASKKKKLN
tara:strand:- start:134 stop:496 length:363 start_codon:yes stop_codon:yes gene_type:complete